MPTPTGEIVSTPEGRDLVIVRSLGLPIEEVWGRLTDPDLTEGWYGTWEGEPGAGNTIQVRMRFEESQPWTAMHIDDCTPPLRLGLSSTDQIGVWRLEVTLLDTGAATEVRLVHHLTSEYQLAEIPQIGPGWEYYADMFVAACTNTARPDFADYYPAMAEYYRAA
ncbi:SRPBCC domain-containing protein [Nocardia neocaledoniensis]|uniref:SRPBCC domain-containing protein n=1 Tax=Nocardia neocaledoniensis TaxID=236511 RepID=UPI002456AD11|nr:SRPBCC domain-containing protein [Nocardia neocaledoniensis]